MHGSINSRINNMGEKEFLSLSVEDSSKPCYTVVDTEILSFKIGVHFTLQQIPLNSQNSHFFYWFQRHFSVLLAKLHIILYDPVIG